MRSRSPTVCAYVAAASSIEPIKHLGAALELLSQSVRVTAVSTVYRTPAIGRPRDPAFLNCVFRMETGIGPRALKFDVLRPIEEALGRQRDGDSFAPLTLDLDLILYGDLVVEEPDLKIPNPDLSRWCVSVPLLELAPGLTIPGSGGPLAGRDQHPGDACAGEPLPDITESLRGRITP